MIIDLLARDLNLLANGYEPIVEHKGKPTYEGWPYSEIRPDSLKIYRQNSSPADGCLVQGTAIRTTHTPCVDIDVVDPELALQVKALVEARLGADPNYPYRVGSKGFAILYRTEQPFQSIKVTGGKRGAVEIHCANSKGGGAKISWFGPHPKGNALVYTQHGTPLERFPHDALFEITYDQVVALAQELVPILGDGADISGLPYDGPKQDWSSLPDPERALEYASWEMANGRGAWGQKPKTGEAHDILHHRALRLQRLGVELHEAIPLFDEWMLAAGYEGETAEQHLPEVYERDARLFGSELPPGKPQKRKASEIWEGMEVAERLRETMEEVGLAPKEKNAGQIFFHLSEARAEWRQPSMLINGLIPDSAVTIVYGDTNVGKTYFAVEIAGCVAACRNVYDKPEFQVELGKSCEQGGIVVILAGENGESVAQSRILAWERAHGLSLEGKVMVARHAIPLDDQSDETGWKAYVRALDAVNENHGPIRLIINDTLKRSIGALDSNKSETAHLFTTLTEALAEKYNCAVIVNAHAPKSGNGIGGSKDFENGVSWSYELLRKNSGDRLELVQIRGVKARTGQQPEAFMVRGKAQELGCRINNNTTDLVFNLDKAGTEVAKRSDVHHDRETKIIEILRNRKAFDDASAVNSASIVGDVCEGVTPKSALLTLKGKWEKGLTLERSEWFQDHKITGSNKRTLHNPLKEGCRWRDETGIWWFKLPEGIPREIDLGERGE